MTMTLYGGFPSPYVARVALAAQFKGMKYTLTPPPGGLKSPEFLKISPFGKVPALKDGKTVICESAVIVEYLEAKGKAKKLVPKAAKAGAVARQVGAIASEYVQRTTSKFYPFFQDPTGNRKAIEEVTAEIDTYLEVLEKLMPKGKYAAGSRASIADVYVIPALFFVSALTGAFGVTDPVAGRPKLKKYMGAMQKDKAAGVVIKALIAAWKQQMGG